jgi:hypothetical protein
MLLIGWSPLHFELFREASRLIPSEAQSTCTISARLQAVPRYEPKHLPLGISEINLDKLG